MAKTQVVYIDSVAGAISDIGLGFAAHAVAIDNPTHAWWYVPVSSRWIAPLALGVIVSFPGATQQGKIIQQTPPGSQSVFTAGEQLSATYMENAASVAGLLIPPAPQWYDRNPVDRSIFYQAALAPHAITIRGTYTCPVNKLALVHGAFAACHRITAAATPDLARSDIRLTGGTILIEAPVVFVNTVGVGESVPFSGEKLLVPGDVTDMATGDASTGGTCWYTLGIAITEYDRS